MWCIRRWTSLQEARLAREREKLRRARAQVYAELMLFEDNNEIVEDDGPTVSAYHAQTDSMEDNNEVITEV